METMTDRFRTAGVSACLFLLVLTGLSCLGSTPAVAASAPADTLVLVNGETITAGDLDELLMDAHQTMNMADETSEIVFKLLNKRTNDLLILQDAYAAGIDEDPELLALLEERRQSYAIRAYVMDNLELPSSPPEDEIEAFYDKYYWQILIRRISVRTFQEASDLRTAIMAGADMDSLARELSLDTKKLNGGLYNQLFWADLENRIRDQVRGLEVGEYSEIFPYNEAFTFCRVENIVPVNRDDYGKDI
jgi:hypothetical protein